MTASTPPNPDQLEVTIFGPGVGECVLVHVGDDQWLCVDSAIHPTTNEPVAAAYLNQIGRNPATCIKRIVVSHWHDDHCRGVAQLVELCADARLVMSSAMTNDEFRAYVFQHEQDRMTKLSSGVRELARVVSILTDKKRRAYNATANRLIWKIENPADTSRNLMEVWCLSPVDAQIQKFHAEIGAQMQKEGATRIRATPQTPNHLSIAVWIVAGTESILLGADLEDTGASDVGWKAVVGSPERPGGQARVFKVPHHGSPTGHNLDVWNCMLMGRATHALLAPFNKGPTKLPGIDDIERLKTFTNNLYASALPRNRKGKRGRDRAVERQIASATKEFFSLHKPYSFVRLRNGGNVSPSTWVAEFFGEARRL